MRRLAVLGGSSPFTAGLIDAFAAAEPAALPPHVLVLHGRNAERLRLVSRYAKVRLEPLGWSVAETTYLDHALEGADVVVHQIRYGGLEGRAQDENLAVSLGIQPDETLGPGALNSLLRMLPDLRETGRKLAARCPDAWVLNLTNPLSAATTVLSDEGVSRCIGLCELPEYTAERAARIVGRDTGATDWAYAGWNHRGFIVDLMDNGTDLLPELLVRLNGAPFEGVPAADLIELGAIPLKYFRWVHSQDPPRAGRADAVASIRRRIFEELEEDPTRSPASLQERYMEWYPLSVVPAVEALSANRERTMVVNRPGPDGLTREHHARVCRHGVQPVPPPSVPAPVRAWLDRFEDHERAVVQVARKPGPESVFHAVELDPMVPAGHTAAAEAVWSQHSVAR